MVSAIERCPLFLSAIKKFFYQTMTMIPSVLRNSVRYREVSAIERFHCILLDKHYSSRNFLSLNFRKHFLLLHILIQEFSRGLKTDQLFIFVLTKENYKLIFDISLCSFYNYQSGIN